EKGPVHLNFPFRKPLEPTPVETDNTSIESLESETPFTKIVPGLQWLGHSDVIELAEIIRNSPRGLIICGPRTPYTDDFPYELRHFEKATGYPIFTDTLSNRRIGYGTDAIKPIGTYDTFLSA